MTNLLINVAMSLGYDISILVKRINDIPFPIPLFVIIFPITVDNTANPVQRIATIITQYHVKFFSNPLEPNPIAIANA